MSPGHYVFGYLGPAPSGAAIHISIISLIWQTQNSSNIKGVSILLLIRVDSSLLFIFLCDTKTLQFQFDTKTATRQRITVYKPGYLVSTSHPNSTLIFLSYQGYQQLFTCMHKNQNKTKILSIIDYRFDYSYQKSTFVT